MKNKWKGYVNTYSMAASTDRQLASIREGWLKGNSNGPAAEYGGAYL